MMLFKRRRTSVRIGERFIKADDHFGLAWKVTRLWTTAVGIPHAQIEKDGQRKETRIIAVSALTDINLFGPVAGPTSAS